MASAQPAAVRVHVLALDGVLDAALGVSVDVLGAANRIALALRRPAPFLVRVLGMGKTVRTGSGLRLEPDAQQKGAPAPRVLVLPGMNLPTPPELKRALRRPDVLRAAALVARLHRQGTLVCAACSATFVCAEAGVLDGRRATTSWWLAPLFRARYPEVALDEGAMVVEAGTVVTAGAALSQVELMLWLVRRFAGPEVAALCARYLVVDERTSQGRYLALEHLSHQSSEVARAESFARRSLHRPIGLSDLARAAGATPRTLERRFAEALGISPLRFLQRLRVERAVHLLQTTRGPIDRIAARVGYDDPATLRRLVRRETGTTLSALRHGSPRPQLDEQRGRRARRLS